MIIDTHSHLNFKAYDNDREDVIKRTQEAGVVCINVGTKFETSKSAIELAEKHKGMFASIGMHPIHIKTDLFRLRMDVEEGAFVPLGEDFDLEKYRELAKSRKVVAVGEIGLDYYYKPKGAAKKEQFKQLQKNIFIEQLKMAKELNLPVIVHCRMAYNDAYEILKSMDVKGVIHSFTGTIEEMEKFLGLGFFIGINGIIFKLDIDEVVRKIPLDKILIETDCPYLTPPQEGKEKRNEPIFAKHVAQKIAELKGLACEDVVVQTTKNAQNLFKI